MLLPPVYCAEYDAVTFLEKKFIQIVRLSLMCHGHVGVSFMKP